jgi:hypothetical protein
MEGEYVDVGCGFLKASPDTCDYCGYAEASHHRDGDTPLDFFVDCWERQIPPYEHFHEYEKKIPSGGEGSSYRPDPF